MLEFSYLDPYNLKKLFKLLNEKLLVTIIDLFHGCEDPKNSIN